MSLTAGAKLGPYEILGQIGAGGMGEVYRAKDPRLGRDVAIKVLPASFSQDTDRLRRFEQEAKAAGLLNHPNITAVHDIGQHDGAPYVVSELLEGETLRSALAGGRLAARRAVDYALQTAHGLAAAHEKGIVHRDLKPENLFVTRDGRVKILDFGLAKLTQAEGLTSDATSLPTETRGTEPGVVLGTLGYMSPEQVRGRPADARSDIFSFGAILYEMLSGKRAFHGDSAADTMSAILREEPPDLSVTNQAISPGLERIVRHCLEKNPEQRFHSAHDLAFDLEALSGTSATAAIPTARRARSTLRAALLVAGVLIGLAAGYFVFRRPAKEGAVAATASPTYRRLTNLAGGETSPALSPDGQTLAFVRRSAGKTDVWIQRAGGKRPTNLTEDCDRSSYSPAFSPDGNRIAYGSDCGEGGVFLMGASGENARRLAPIGSNPSWSPDGRELVYGTELAGRPYGRPGTSELWAVEIESGKTRRLFAEDGIQPSVSPHGLRIAYWGLPAGGSQRDIWTIPLKGLASGEKPVPVTQDPAIDWNPVWSPDGRSLYYLSNRAGAMNLWRVAIDESTGKPLGPPEPLTLPAREVGGFAISGNGLTFAYVDSEATYSIDRLSIDPRAGSLAGKPEEILQTSQEIADIDVSPDGALIAFDSRGGQQDDLFLMRSDGTGLRQLTEDSPRDRGPAFSPDGRKIAFHSDRGGRYEIWTIAPDGSGLTQLTSTKGDETTIEPHWSPDGRRLTYNSSGKGAFLVELDSKGAVGKVEPLPRPAPNSFPTVLSWLADGRGIAASINRVDTSTYEFAIFRPDQGKYEMLPSPPHRRRSGRGAATGEHILYLDPDGLHVIDRVGGARLLVPRPSTGSFPAVSCRRDGKVCYLTRINDNADIWQATLPERP